MGETGWVEGIYDGAAFAAGEDRSAGTDAGLRGWVCCGRDAGDALSENAQPGGFFQAGVHIAENAGGICSG